MPHGVVYTPTIKVTCSTWVAKHKRHIAKVTDTFSAHDHADYVFNYVVYVVTFTHNNEQ